MNIENKFNTVHDIKFQGSEHFINKYENLELILKNLKNVYILFYDAFERTKNVLSKKVRRIQIKTGKNGKSKKDSIL